eukprot:497636_1
MCNVTMQRFVCPSYAPGNHIPMLKTPATWAGALIVTGLPIFLFYNSRKQPQYKLTQSIDENKESTKPIKAIISPDKGLLIRCTATTTSFAAILGLLYKLYPRPDSPNGQFINFSLCSWIFHWNAIMIEMTLSGPQYFSSRNITKIWQVLLSSNQHWRIRFITHPSNHTRRNALYQLLDYAIHGIFGITTYLYLTSSYIDTSTLSVISKSIAMNFYILATLPISAGLISTIFALIFGDNINVRYCYDSPLKSTSMETFWKRWSLQIGEPLRDYVYIPLGGKRNGSIAVCMSFLANALAHSYLFGIITRGNDLHLVGYLKCFSVVSVGTLIDMMLKRYDNSSTFMSILRYGLMLTTLIGQLAVPWNDLSSTKNAFIDPPYTSK